MYITNKLTCTLIGQLYLQLFSICPAHLRYQHLLLPNQSRVECLGFVYVNPGPLFLSALVIVEYFSCVSPLLNCIDPSHCPVPRLACLIPPCICTALCSFAISQNVDLSVPSSLYGSYPFVLIFDFACSFGFVCLSAFLIFDFCFVYFDHNSCLLLGTFAHQLFGFDLCLFF